MEEAKSPAPTTNSSSSKTTGNVLVVARCRPLNASEIERGSKCCLDFAPDGKAVTISMTSETSSAYGANKFVFDRVFDMKSQQREVYDVAARPIIDSVLDGFNGTIFAYGQTSSGKTHTMQGPDINDVEKQGIIPRMVRTVFSRIENASENVEFTVKVSMSEIYNERIKDLLDPMKDNLKIHEEKGKGVYIQDITEQYVVSDTEVYNLMAQGNQNRSITATKMNAESSRSHSLFVITITMLNNDDGSCKTGKLYLVDLAGSEKIAKTGAQGQTLEEAKNINKSLTTLGKVIVALTDKKSTHVPYRESKLTRILSESLGGNSKTCLIITCSPHPFNDQETLSTLRFGARARNIKNAPKVNKEYTVPELRRLLEKAEEKIEQQENKIKVLTKQIIDMGGKVLDDRAIEKQAQQMELEKAKQEAEELEKQLKEAELAESMAGDTDAMLDSEMDNTPIRAVDLEALQEKQDEIERLQDLLEKEKDELKDSRKQVATLSENLQIAEQRCEHALLEREKFSERSKEYIHRMEEMQDQMKEMEFQLEEHETKMTHYKDELEIMKQANDVYQRKIEHLYANNIIIAKERKDGDGADEKSGQQDGLAHIQEEVRQLHFQLQQKDQVNRQLTQLVKKRAGHRMVSDDIDTSVSSEQQAEDSALDQELQRILKGGEENEVDGQDQKQREAVVLSMLSAPDVTSNEDLDQVNFSVLLNPSQIKQVLEGHNEVLQQIAKKETEAKESAAEMEKLKQTLDEQLSKEQPNIGEIVQAKVEEAKHAEAKKFDQEREQLHKDLLNRVEKVLKLEMQLDEMKDAYKQLENTISKDDLKYKQKAQNLEKNLDNIHQMYQNSTSEKSILKVDLQVAERKLARKEEKIQQLEQNILVSRQKQQKYLSIIKQLKQEFIKVQSQQMQISQLSTLQSAGGIGSSVPRQIQGGSQAQGERRTIRGGGGKLVTPRIISRQGGGSQAQ